VIRAKAVHRSQLRPAFDHVAISRTFCAANLDCVSGSLISRSTIARLDVLAPFEVADQTGWL
jgi:hypothetical protein